MTVSETFWNKHQEAKAPENYSSKLFSQTYRRNLIKNFIVWHLTVIRNVLYTATFNKEKKF